jgi:hypothetical protein
MPDASSKIGTTTQIVHIGSGASLAAGAISGTADISTALTSTNLALYPRADVQLLVRHTTSMSSASQAIYLYRRDLNFDSTNDEPIPNTATNTLYKAKFMGAFIAQPASVTSNSHSSAMQVTDVPLPGNCQCEFYIENGTNANILAGWTLKVLPKTDVGATA